MCKLFISIFFFSCLNNSFAQDCPSPESETQQTSSQFNVTHGLGFIWEDKEENRPFVYPSRRGVSAIRAGAFWVAGKDSNNNLKMTHQRGDFGIGRKSWFAGPYDPDTNCEFWDRMFELSKTDLDIFKADLADGKIDDTIPISIMGWPGNGNPHFTTIHGFEMPNSEYGYAAFEDVDGDKIYDPEKGDFPINNGTDHSSWSITNDLFSIANFPSVGVEIQLTSNTFNQQGKTLDNSIVYEVKLINKSGGRLTDMGFTIWISPGLGCVEDDFFGCSPENNLAYIYNADDLDGYPTASCALSDITYGDEIPLIGIKVLKPFQGIDNEMLNLSSFIYYNTILDPAPITMLNTDSPDARYNFMNGLWRDGSPMTVGGIGVGGNIPTKYVFSDPPNDEDGWSMCTAQPPSNFRMIMLNFTPFELDHNESNTMTFSVTGIEDVQHPCPDITPLIERTDALEEIWNDRILTSTSSISIDQDHDLKISPNPTSDMISISLTGKDKIDKIELVNLQGQLIMILSNVGKASLQMDLSGLNCGTYILLVRTELDKNYNHRVIKIN